MTGLTGNNILSGASGQTTGYDIEQSLRVDGFPGTTQQILTRSPSSSGNRKTFTISFWWKPSLFNKAEDDYVIKVKPNNDNQFMFNKNAGADNISIVTEVSTSIKTLKTTRVFRDPNWYHFVIAVDTTQATASNRLKLYVNGVQETDFDIEEYPDQDWEFPYNESGVNQDLIYSREDSGRSPSGYFAEWHSIDGTALDASSFGETNEDTNQWVPIEYDGSYGTNGFYLKFQDSSALGDDSSGNTNDFTPTNLAATDQVLDSPTNNFATMNPLDPLDNRATTSTFAEGNLKVTETGGGYKNTMIGNFGMSNGKWYFEFCGVNSDNTWMIGIADITKGTSRGYTGSSGDGLYLYRDGDTYSPTSSASYGVSWTYGDVIGVAVDLDNNALYFAKNNTWMNSGDPTSGSSKTGAAFTTELADRTWAACMGRGSYSNTIIGTFNFGQDSSFAGAKTAQGNGPDGTDLYYDPPSGYIPMCTAQMDDPSIADPTAHFNTVLYTGDGTNGRTISGVGFQPDWLWNKSRSATGHNMAYDSVRGSSGGYLLRLNINATSAETATSDEVKSFTSDGFITDSSQNASGVTYVGWNWKAGGTASSNTDGSITSSVSANTDAGFSIVSWTGTGSNATVGHGLSQAPELVINKSRGDAYNWVIQSFLWNSASDTNILYLNTTAGTADDTNVFQAAPTATVFSPQGGSWGGIGTNTIEYIAYCVHSVDGYSMVGKYAGNGAEDGSFVYTGFRPAFIFIKRITSSGSNSYIVDNKRIGYNHFVYLTDAGSNKYLWPDSNAAEGNGNTTKGIGMDILSNGFKFRTSGGDYNASGNDYLFYAIAESPFKYSNAR